MRNCEIEILLNGAFLCVGEKCDHWPRLDAAPRLALRGLLKRALFQCDAIADLETQALAPPCAEPPG